MKKQLLSFALLALLIGLISACHKEDAPSPRPTGPNTGETSETFKGVYILNEGSLNTNNASLDFLDFEKDSLYKDVFAEANPEIVKGLGDVASDLGIYGSKMYIIVNNSNKIEIVDAHSAKRLGKIDFPKGRFVAFYGGNAFVTSTTGEVAVIDTASLSIEKTIKVGENPEGLAVVGDKLYVANSGGYQAPVYDSTLSVIDLNTLQEIKKIAVGINVQNMAVSKNGNLYVNSFGNYDNIPANLYCIDTDVDTVKTVFDIAASGLVSSGDSILVYDYDFTDDSKSFTLIDAETNEVLSDHFIDADVAQNIQVPYSLAVRTDNGDIYVSDAKDYTNPGTVYCLDQKGEKKWQITAGVSPGHYAFLYHND